MPNLSKVPNNNKSLTTTEIYLHSVGDSQVTALEGMEGMEGMEGRFSTDESETATKNKQRQKMKKPNTL